MTILKQRIADLISANFPSLFFRIAYIHNRHRIPHFNHPRDLSEIWIQKLLRGDINKISYLADKYAVRQFISQKGLSDILIPLIGVWDNPNDIDFSKLPNKFALKMNYGAGMNIICTNKNKLDIPTTKDKLYKWINTKGYNFSERHYNLIPRKIICEKFIEDGHGGFPFDYKFMCIYGEPFCILACGHRESGHADYSPYSLDWKPLYEYKKGGNFNVIEKPKHLKEMINIAKKLSAEIDLVRVDLYDTTDKVLFGEMTLTPAGCIFHRWTQKAINDMGDYYHYEK